MTTWDDIFKKHLALGADHGYAAFAADRYIQRLEKSTVLDVPCPDCGGKVFGTDGVDAWCDNGECGWLTMSDLIAALFVEWLGSEVE